MEVFTLTNEQKMNKAILLEKQILIMDRIIAFLTALTIGFALVDVI